MKLFINALLPTSSAAFKKVHLLFDETIHKVSVQPLELEEPYEEIDLGGKIVLPGAVDAHCHIVDSIDPTPAISQISRFALLGGWTTIGELSYQSQMPIFDYQDLRLMQSFLDDSSYVNIPLWGNVEIENYPYHAENALDLWTKGALGLAIFSPSPNESLSGMSFTEIMDLFLDVYTSDTAFLFQGWDQELHKSPSFEAQQDAIKKILRRMQENPIHIPRVASWDTIEFLNGISKRSDISFSLNILDIMALFDEELDLPRHHDLLENKALLWELIRTNKIYILSNNAAPNASPDDIIFGTEEAQMLSYSYIWLLAELWKKRKVPLATVIKMCSENAAKRLGVYPQKGCINAGADADFVIYDPQGTTEVTFPDGRDGTLPGRIESIWMNGEKVLQDGEILMRKGAYLPRRDTPKRRHNRSTWI
ncbi:MAG: amidohydrolase family protein [Candidatus Cloacimonetes bacterium]|nr:amidohydrolase family protein [Candidatus Cloacimonadota bacterium]